MKRLFCLMLMGVLTAQNFSINKYLNRSKSQQPKLKKEFYLTYYDIRESIMEEIPNGQVLVEFIVDENGKVIEPQITNTFDVRLSDTIINKVLQVEFKPGLQNGIPVRVKYKLPIVFK